MGISDRCKLSPRVMRPRIKDKCTGKPGSLEFNLRPPIEKFGNPLPLSRHDVALPAAQVQTNALRGNFNLSIFPGFGGSKRTGRTIGDDVLRSNVARDAFSLAQQIVGRLRQPNLAAAFLGDL